MEIKNNSASTKLTYTVILAAVFLSMLFVVPTVLSALSNGSVSPPAGFINWTQDGLPTSPGEAYSADLDNAANITLQVMQDNGVPWVQLFVNCSGSANETFYVDIDDNASTGDLGGNEFMIHTNCTPLSSAVFMYNSTSAAWVPVTKDVGWVIPPAPIPVDVAWNGTAPASETAFNYCPMYVGPIPAQQNLTISKNSDGTFVTVNANFTNASCMMGPMGVVYLAPGGFIAWPPDGIGNETAYMMVGDLDPNANVTLLAMQDNFAPLVQIFANSTNSDSEVFYVDLDFNISSGDVASQGTELRITTDSGLGFNDVECYNGSAWNSIVLGPPPKNCLVSGGNVSLIWNGTAPASETLLDYCMLYGLGPAPNSQNLTVYKNSDGTNVTLVANFTNMNCTMWGPMGNLSISINKSLINWTAYPPGFGDNVTFLLNITNNGTMNITQLYVWDTYLNTSLEFLGATFTPNSTIPQGFNYSTLYWNFSWMMPLPVNQSLLINTTFMVIENWTLNETNWLEVEAWDMWGMNATASTNITIPIADIFPPVINLVSPGNTSWNTNGSVTYWYNVSDNIRLTSCSLYINGTLNATDPAPINGVVNSFPNVGMADGTFLWNVSCSDGSNQGWSAQTWTINVDTQSPSYSDFSASDVFFNDNVTLWLNVTDSNLNTSSVTFEIVDAATGATSIDGPFSASCALMAGSSYNCSYTWVPGATADGNYTYNITAFDIVGNNNTETAPLWFVFDDTPPAKGPWGANDTYFNSQISFWVMANDTFLDTAATNITVINSVGTVFDVTENCNFVSGISYNCSVTSYTPPAVGNYTYNITAIDLVGNNNTENSFAFGGVWLFYDNINPLANLYNVTESSAHLYYNYTSNTLWYGDNMGSPQTFVIQVNASDIPSGLDYATGSTMLGDTPTDATEGAAPDVYDLTYNATAADTSTGVITISVYDLSGNLNNSVTVNVDRDTTNPRVFATSVTESSPYLYSPNATTLFYSNGMGASAHSFAWQGTASDPDAGLDQATFTSAFSDVQPADTTPGNWSATYDIANVDTGTQTITVTVTNNVGDSNGSVMLTGYEDLTPPSIGLPAINVPAETNINSNIKVNATYSDAGAGSRNCTYDVTNAVTGTVVLNDQVMHNDFGANGTANGTIASLADALYNITVSCTDNVDNSNTSAITQVLIDIQPPNSSVNMITPYWHGAGKVPFDVNVTASDPGNSGVVSVDLYYRYSPNNATWGAWTYNGTDNTTPWSFSFNGTDGYYEFYSNATDNATNTEVCGTPDTGAAIDTTPPTVVLNAPMDNINTTLATQEYNFTPTDNLPTPITCNLSINGTFVNSTTSAINGSVNSLGHTFAAEGAYLWNMTCWDNVGNMGASASTWTINYDATAPDASGANVTLEGGATYATNRTLNFAWAGFVDTFTGILGYYYNFTNNEGTANGTWDTASPGQLTAPADGAFTVYVWAEDLAGNIGLAANDSIIVDTTPPNITSTNPLNGELGVLTSTTVSFTFSEKMNASSVNNMTFCLNGSTVPGTITTTNNKTFKFTPDSPLTYINQYTATVKTGVKDLAGNNLAADYSWNFTTRSTPTGNPFPGGGGGGGSSYTPHFNFKYYNSTEASIKDGTTADLTFSDGEEHKMAFEVGPDFIDVRIWSKETSGRIYVGETKTFDTDGSGLSELSITLSEIKNSIAKITLSEIPETAPPTEIALPEEVYIPEEEAAEPEEAQPAKEKKVAKESTVQKIQLPWPLQTPDILLVALALIVITVVLGGWWYYTIS